MNRQTRFLVVDDHPVFIQGLVYLLESDPHYKVVAQAGNSADALLALDASAPDIIIVDISLPNENGLDLIREIRHRNASLPILVISMYDEVIYAERVLKLGCQGYVMKQEASTVMLNAIKAVLAGKVHVSDAMNDRLLSSIYRGGDERNLLVAKVLSERELGILEYIGQGYGISEISDILNLSVKTVNNYRDHIKDKLELDNAAEVRKFAVKWWQSREM